MFRINCQIPRCVLTWVLVVIAFCHDVLYEPCDGFSDLLSVLLELYATLWGLLFNFYLLSSLSGLDLSDYVWGFKNNSFTFVVASLSLLHG